MLVLTVAKGPDRGAVFELPGVTRVIIGRNSPDLKLNDIMISRYHARLKLDRGRWYVRDLGSRNGTKLNGQLIDKPTVLKTGDHILTGYTELEVRLVADPVEAAGATEQGDQNQDAAGAESSMVIGEISDDQIPGGESSDDLTSHREEPPAAVIIDKPVEPRPVVKPPVTPAAAPAPAPSPTTPPPSLAGERPATEWKSAIESQLDVVKDQGWDEAALDDEDEEFVPVVVDDEVEPLDDDQRSLLYFDEDHHWVDDVIVDDEELLNSLEEDGPQALIDADLPGNTPATPGSGSPGSPTTPRSPGSPGSPARVADKPLTKARRRRR